MTTVAEWVEEVERLREENEKLRTKLIEEIHGTDNPYFVDGFLDCDVEWNCIECGGGMKGGPGDFASLEGHIANHMKFNGHTKYQITVHGYGFLYPPGIEDKKPKTAPETKDCPVCKVQPKEENNPDGDGVRLSCTKCHFPVLCHYGEGREKDREEAIKLWNHLTVEQVEDWIREWGM